MKLHLPTGIGSSYRDDDVEIVVSEARMNSVSHWGIPWGFKKNDIKYEFFTLRHLQKV